jgi:hypothetical protein
MLYTYYPGLYKLYLHVGLLVNLYMSSIITNADPDGPAV